MLFPKRTVQSIYYDTLNFSYIKILFDDTDRFKSDLEIIEVPKNYKK